MSDKLNNILIPNVSKLPGQKGVDKTNRLKSGDKSEFSELLKKSITPEKKPQTEGISLSTHAAKRLQQRNLEIDSEEFQKLKTGIDKLKQKGGQDSLIITGKAAYIVDVPQNKIVTVIDTESVGENVFTKIDSTLILN